MSVCTAPFDLAVVRASRVPPRPRARAWEVEFTRAARPGGLARLLEAFGPAGLSYLAVTRALEAPGQLRYRLTTRPTRRTAILAALGALGTDMDVVRIRATDPRAA